jgi:hypothetical protein
MTYSRQRIAEVFRRAGMDDIADAALATLPEGQARLSRGREQVARIRRPPDAGRGALARGSMVSTSERISKW